MTTLPTETTKPQEVNKPQEVSEKKGPLISTKFEKAKTKFGSFATSIKQSLSKLKHEKPQIIFDAEQHEIDQLSEKLAKLDQATNQTLEASTENLGSSIISTEQSQSLTEDIEGTPSPVASAEVSEQVSAKPTEQATEASQGITEDSGVKEPTPAENIQDAAIEIKDPRQRTTKALQELHNETKAKQLERAFTTKGILGDSDKIEGHQIDFIHRADDTIVNFKMTQPMTEKVTSEVIPTIPLEQLKDGRYDFKSAVNGQQIDFVDCWIIRIDDNTRIFVSKGETVQSYTENDYSKPILDEQGKITAYESKTTTHKADVRALIGAVKFEVKDITDVQQVTEKVYSAFDKLKITEALVPPGKEAEDKYKEARFRWQHKLTDDSVFEEYKEKFKLERGDELLDHMQSKEVLPGYFTIVDKGASERYQQEGKLFIVHHVYNQDNLPNLLENGLLASHERFKRGITVTGMSTKEDFATGGADSVFVRAIPQNASDAAYGFGYGVDLIIDPKVLDRTDWYAYNQDSYGTTSPERFNDRPSAEEFFATQRKNYDPRNEIMMRRGISPEMISAIVVGTEEMKIQLIAHLQGLGISDMNNIPFEDFIKVYTNFGDLKKDYGLAETETIAVDDNQEATV